MMPNHVRFFKPSRPARPDVIGVKMGRATDFRQIGVTICYFGSNPLGLPPRIRFGYPQRVSPARKRKLEGAEMPAVLIDDAADRRRVKPARYAIEHNLGDGRLALFGFSPSLKIDGFGKAAEFARRRVPIE